MIPLNEVHIVCLYVPPQIPRRVLSTVNTDETAHAVVGVHSEVIYPSKVAYKWNSDMETYVCG